jgi:hypothetical protein
VAIKFEVAPPDTPEQFKTFSMRGPIGYASSCGMSIMTKHERKRFAAVIEAAECLYLENIALKLVLEHREVANWQMLVERIMQDAEILDGIHLKFRDLYEKLERVPDASAALDNLLAPLPRSKKAH